MSFLRTMILSTIILNGASAFPIPARAADRCEHEVQPQSGQPIWGSDLSKFRQEIVVENPAGAAPSGGGSEKLLVRPATTQDINFVRELFNDALVARLFAVDQDGKPLDPMEELSWSEAALSKGEGGYFLISHGDGQPMGVVVFWKVEPQTLGRTDPRIYVRTGIALSKAFRRKGYANKIGPELLQMGLNRLGIDHIVARIHVTNQLSINTTQSLGYVEFAGPESERADWRYFATPAILGAKTQ